MPDRSLRLPLSLAFGLTHAGGRGSTLLRDGRPSSPPQDSQGSGGSDSSGGSGNSADSGNSGSSKDDNPFAPPPEGTPDQPWRPRPGNGGDSSDDKGRSPWGSQWSDRQPGRSQGGGFGERPGKEGGGQGPDGNSGPGSGMRWDPTDPAQRRARYALLSGMWAFFFALFGWRYVALLLGALALHWGISSLRSKPKQPDPTAPATQQPAADPAGTKPQTTAAVSGLVTASLALAMVAATFAAQLVYRDYYTCVNDALTSQSKQECNDLLPKQLRPLLEERD
ncbi:hypothetical protein [Streptomyces sp. NPDC002853]